jgi:hypothetical protein
VTNVQPPALLELFELSGRAERDTWVSSRWCDADAAHALARERGVRLRVG